MSHAPRPVITPKDPPGANLGSYLPETLLETRRFHVDTPQVAVKLDQNESPWDWSTELKARVLKKLEKTAWNRYPTAYAEDLAAQVAAYAGVPANAVLLAPGSNYLVALVLSTFTRRIKGKVVIAQPSFLLFELHCRNEGIPYELWPLDDDLEFDLGRMPELPPGSMVIFASPNNPVGNWLARQDLDGLLTQHPDVLFVADEAYFEFSAEPYTELLARHSNLLILRTLSKALGAAGVRLGYCLGSPLYIAELSKVRLPFLLNLFTLTAAEEVLTDPRLIDYFLARVDELIAERRRVYAALKGLSKAAGFTVKDSAANFLLLRWPTAEASQVAYRSLIDHGVLIRNVSAGPRLAGCLRASIGTKKDNDLLLTAVERGLCQ